MRQPLKQKNELQFRNRGCSGQALVEFALVSLLLVALLFGLIDFGRAIMVRQVMVNLTREGSNLASRNTTLTDTLNALAVSANPLAIDQKGLIILTSVSRDATGKLSITAQQSRGGISASSKVGTTASTSVNLPTASLPATNQTLYVTEVFYQYSPVTPVGKLINGNVPAVLYDAAFF